MCYNKYLFTSFTNLSQPLDISLPNGNIISILAVGTVPISDYITLENDLYVPNFNYNLLSVSKLAFQRNCVIQFTHDTCCLQSSFLKKPLFLDKAQKGLYLTHDQIVSTPFIASTDASGVSVSSCNLYALSWHAKLGHLPFSKLKTLNL